MHRFDSLSKREDLETDRAPTGKRADYAQRRRKLIGTYKKRTEDTDISFDLPNLRIYKSTSELCLVYVVYE